MAEDKKTEEAKSETPEASQDNDPLIDPRTELSEQAVSERLATEELDDFVEAEVPVSETETETETETESPEASGPAIAAAEAPGPVIEERIVERRGGFGAALLGGVVAALIGFVVGKGQFLDDFLPPSLRTATVTLEPLEAAQADLKSELAALKGSVAEIEVPDVAPLAARLEALEAAAPDEESSPDVDRISAEIAALTERVAALETRPVTETISDEVIADFEAELQRVRDNLTAQQAEVERMVSEAQDMERASAEAARIAAAQSVVARLRSALDAGTAFTDHVQELARLEVTVPAELQATAETGVTPLGALQDQFAPAARAALAAAREESKGTGGLIAYVNRHLGARSVAPRAGDDPDAILSRAGAAVAEGKISAALEELSTLPESAQAGLAAWQNAARTRLDAEAATDALSQSLNAN